MRARRFFSFLPVVAAGVALSASSAFASAWTRAAGEMQLITTASVYRTDRYYDVQGDPRSQEPLLKTELNPYLEYGLSDTLTLGGSLFVQYFSTGVAPAASSFATERFYGAELEMFARQRLWKWDRFVISAEALVKPPSLYARRDFSRTETGTTDAQLGVYGGFGDEINGHGYYLSLEPAYRLRTGGPADQLRINVTGGVQMTPQWTAIAQIFNSFAVNAPDQRPFTRLGEDDYDLTKLQLSVLYQLSDGVGIQLGGFHHLRAENTGGGGGGLVALWLNF